MPWQELKILKNSHKDLWGYQKIYLNNTVDTIVWSNLSNNAYTIVVDDSYDSRENSKHVFVSELLRRGDSTQLKITKSGTYVVTFVEEMTSRGWLIYCDLKT